jgi:protein SCO1
MRALTCWFQTRFGKPLASGRGPVSSLEPRAVVSVWPFRLRHFGILAPAAILFSASLLPAAVGPQPILPPRLQGIGIEQHLNAPLPLDATFRDESGRVTPLRAYFGKRPVLLALVYYTCPMLCNQILTGVAAALSPLRLRPGRDFDFVAISINPAETPADAAAKRAFVVHRYSSRASPDGWHFLVGDQASIHAVAEAVGFHYRYDPPTKMYFHASGVMAVTPAGNLSRYFYGVDYEPKDLKLGLVEASHNKIGSLADQVLLFCYHYDPKTGKYSAAVLNLLRGSGVAILGLLALALIPYWRREIRQQRQLSAEARRR